MLEYARATGERGGNGSPNRAGASVHGERSENNGNNKSENKNARPRSARPRNAHPLFLSSQYFGTVSKRSKRDRTHTRIMLSCECPPQMDTAA